ncbi:MAG: cadherin domain-containing protein [Rhizobiales bacterium]|nr:cadherin domain-containing protein [Hyphomicrobiales bacterium]MBI3672503.1 cadherin domain-containing protein [Hyphomicrobiales bacterium]
MAIDTAPTITSDGGGATANVYVDENTTAVTTVTAVDLDGDINLTYSIVSGGDSAKFKIDVTTGVLTFIKAPDFENPADVGANNVYNIQVAVSDGTLTTTQALSVIINDVTPVTIVGSDSGEYIAPGLTILGQPSPTTENDVVYGNGGNDWLDGGMGADTMYGGAGDDTYFVDNVLDVVIENADEGLDGVISSVSWKLGASVEYLSLAGTAAINGIGNELDNWLGGNSGANTLDGGAGADQMWGGKGNDIYIIENVGDVAHEDVGEGTDTVKSSVSHVLEDNVENLILTGTGAIDGTGNAANNVITGNAASNVLSGGAGNDTLDGGAGADTMSGGLGNDIYAVDNSGDVVVENVDEGTDTVNSRVSYTLGVNLENLTLTGVDAVNGTGNVLDNTITGNSQANTLVGRGGSDTLNGGGGADLMIGGIGDDHYVVDNVGDVVTELLGEGTDSVRSSITYTLTANVEQLTLAGSANISGAGNGAGNIIIGNSGANVLYGYGAADRLDGGAGADTLIGGTGNDVYIVDNVGDVVQENSGEGTDSVYSGVSFTLSANVENLALTGAALVNGTGNELANAITGNGSNNVLSGLDGNDTLKGMSGNDTLDGGNGDDVINGGLGVDLLTGGAGNDTFVYSLVRDSGILSTTRDTIADFATGDHIDLSAIDANLSVAGDQAFVLDTDGSFSIGEIKLEVVGSDLLLSLNQDTDAAAELTVLLKNVTSLSASDFIL